jgi:hypothetical protein
MDILENPYYYANIVMFFNGKPLAKSEDEPKFKEIWHKLLKNAVIAIAYLNGDLKYE